jgi:hypothetical protein
MSGTLILATHQNKIDRPLGAISRLRRVGDFRYDFERGDYSNPIGVVNVSCSDLRLLEEVADLVFTNHLGLLYIPRSESYLY